MTVLTENVLTENVIECGEVWESSREKHLGKRVKVLSLTPRAVNVLVLHGGASQNNRRVRNKKEHIGLEEFKAHYVRRKESVPSDQLDVGHYSPPPSISLTEIYAQPTYERPKETPKDMTTIELERTEQQNIQEQNIQEQATQDTGTQKPSVPEEKYDFKIDELLERTVKVIKRWGGTPIKSYVIQQYVSKNLTASRTRQLIRRGVELGVLDAWEVPGSRPGTVQQFVGLPGGTRIPARPDGTYPLTGQQTAHTARTSSLSIPARVEPRTEPQRSEPQRIVAPVQKTTQKPVSKSVSKSAITSQSYRQQQAEQVRATIQRQYDGLSQETRDEIALLIMDNVHAQKLQKQFHVMGAVIGMIKRDHGIKTFTELQAEAHARKLQRDTEHKAGRKAEDDKVERQKRRDILDKLLPTSRPPVVQPVAPVATAAEAVEIIKALDAEQAAMIEEIVFESPNLFERHLSSKTMQTFNVTVLVTMPTEHIITVNAETMEDALREVRSGKHGMFSTPERGTVEVVSVTKVRS